MCHLNPAVWMGCHVLPQWCPLKRTQLCHACPLLEFQSPKKLPMATAKTSFLDSQKEGTQGLGLGLPPRGQTALNRFRLTLSSTFNSILKKNSSEVADLCVLHGCVLVQMRANTTSKQKQAPTNPRSHVYDHGYAEVALASPSAAPAPASY